MDRWVGFGSYTFNAAEGGGITGTFSKHTVTAGALSANIDETRGYRKFNVEGEAGMTIRPVDGTWKVDAIDIIEDTRIL